MEIESFYRTVSQALKGERTAKNMTLEETAKGICSLSYLSKIENCALIPDDMYIEALCERLDIDAKKLYQMKARTNLETLLELYLFDQTETLQQMYEDIDLCYYNAGDMILEILVLLTNQNFPKVKKKLRDLMSITSSLTRNEFAVLMYLKLKSAIEMHVYEEIADIIQFFTRSHYFCNSFKWLVYEALFTCGYFTDDRNLIEFYFSELHHIHQIGFPQQHLMKIQWMMLDYQAQFSNSPSCSKIEYYQHYDLGTKQKQDYLFFKASIYAKHHKFHDAYMILHKMPDRTARELALLVYVSSFLQDDGVFRSIRKKVAEYSFSKYELFHQKFIQFWIQLQQDQPHHVIGEILKYDVLVYNQTHPYPLYSKIYKDQLIQISHRKMYAGEVNKYILEDKK